MDHIQLSSLSRPAEVILPIAYGGCEHKPLCPSDFTIKNLSVS